MVQSGDCVYIKILFVGTFTVEIRKIDYFPVNKTTSTSQIHLLLSHFFKNPVNTNNFQLHVKCIF